MSYVQIPFLDNFWIDGKTGEIIDSEGSPVERIYYGYRSMSIINGIEYSTIDLLIRSFISLHPLVWEYRDRGKKCKTLEDIYFILNVEPTDDENCISIDNTLYRRIQEHPQYFVSKDGTIYSGKTNQFMRKRYSFGYPIISLLVDNRKFKLQKVHRLVYCTWNDKSLSTVAIVHHLDNRKYNSTLENLEESSVFQNTRYAIIDGKKLATFSIEQVERLCVLHKNGKSNREISIELFGTPDHYRDVVSMVYRLRQGKAYKDLAQKYSMDNEEISSRNTVSKDQVIEICKLIDLGYSPYQIARKFNVSWVTISRIHKGLRWKDISSEFQFASKFREGSTTIERISGKKSSGE